MKCPLCGNEFDKADETKCTGCGNIHSCSKQCCPNCGYEIIKEAKIIQSIRKFFKW